MPFLTNDLVRMTLSKERFDDAANSIINWCHSNGHHKTKFTDLIKPWRMIDPEEQAASRLPVDIEEYVWVDAELFMKILATALRRVLVQLDWLTEREDNGSIEFVKTASTLREGNPFTTKYTSSFDGRVSGVWRFRLKHITPTIQLDSREVHQLQRLFWHNDYTNHELSDAEVIHITDLHRSILARHIEGILKLTSWTVQALCDQCHEISSIVNVLTRACTDALMSLTSMGVTYKH